MFPRCPAFASCGQDVRWESLRCSSVRAHLQSVSFVCTFHLDAFIRLLSTANYGLHPTVLDLLVAIIASSSLGVFPAGPDIRSLSVVSSLMSFSDSSWRHFLVAGESEGDAGDSSYHSGEQYMTSLPEDGERRPMSLRQDSDEPPAGGGLSDLPPSSSCCRTGC